MADVFISYSKADRSLALKLAAMLEAEGWKTWWDTSLIPGDDFRNEIMTELGHARAVIVIWTDASIKSDWVRSEAGRAQADRKLIPIKLPNLSYKDLPPPFDVLHTENLGEEDKIRAAVVAQLAKPAVEPSAVALLTKGFRNEVLTWVGIVGGALTLFGNLDAVLKLADWARVLVQHWKEWTHAFWLWAFGWLGIHVPADWTFVLNFLSFGLLLTISQASKYKVTTNIDRNNVTHEDRSFTLISWRTFFCIVVMFACFAVSASLYLLMHFRSAWFYDISFMTPNISIVLFARKRLYATISVLLLFVFSYIITILPSAAINPEHVPMPAGSSTAFITTMWFLPLIVLSVAPAKAINRRLIFLAFGLLLLIVLNELSKLGLDVTAPKLQG